LKVAEYATFFNSFYPLIPLNMKGAGGEKRENKKLPLFIDGSSHIIYIRFS
jgi:hypothetical protein